MTKYFLYFIVLLFTAFQGSIQEAQNEFRLANMFTDGVVLQRGNAYIWGYGTPGTTVAVDLIENGVPAEVLAVDVGDDGVWGGALNVERVGFGYKLDLIMIDNDPDNGGSILGEITIDVAFGEVWLCSGQSNMQWKINGVRNSAEEIQTASLYENIRLTQVWMFMGQFKPMRAKNLWY